MLNISNWCCVNSGLSNDFNMNAFDINNPADREIFRNHNGLHTYESLNKKGWICAEGEVRGKGETIGEAEMDCISKLYKNAQK